MNHDIDQILNELEMDGEWESPPEDTLDEDTGELEWEGTDPDALEFEGELEFETSTSADSPLTEDEEMEFAAELLEVTSDADLDQFLGRVVRRAARGVRNLARRGRKVLRSPLARRLVNVAKGVARRALPVAGRVVGTAVGGPAGGAIGGRVAATAGRTFGLELEGLSPEDQEYEAARRVVRFAAAATNAAAANQARGAPAPRALRSAVVSAARRHAPGLLRSEGVPAPVGMQSGRWVRRGNRIILSGV